jgi:hypothetical protein
LDQFADSPVKVVVSEIVRPEMKRHIAEAVAKASRDAREGLQGSPAGDALFRGRRE